MNAYEKVEAIRAANPTLSTEALAKKAGVTRSSYYSSKSHVKVGKTATKKKPSPTYKKIKLEAPPAKGPIATGNVAVVIGTPAQVREVLGGLQ